MGEKVIFDGACDGSSLMKVTTLMMSSKLTFLATLFFVKAVSPFDAESLAGPFFLTMALRAINLQHCQAGQGLKSLQSSHAPFGLSLVAVLS